MIQGLQKTPEQIKSLKPKFSLGNCLQESVIGVETRNHQLTSLHVQFTSNDGLEIGVIPPADAQNISLTKRTLSTSASIALRGNETIYRSLSIPKISRNEQDILIRSALESTLTVPIDQYEICWQQVQGKTNCFLVLKETLKNTYEKALESGLKPTWFFPKALALKEAALYLLEGFDQFIIADIDADECVLVYISNGMILDTKSIEGIKDCSSDECWKSLREMARILLAWQESSGLSPESPMLISGLLSFADKEVISKFTKHPLLTASNDTPSKVDLIIEYLPSIGAALLAKNADILHETCGYQIGDCLSNELSDWIKPIGLSLVLVMIMAFLVSGISQYFLAAKQEELKHSFSELLTYIPSLSTGNTQKIEIETPSDLNDLDEVLMKVEERLKTHDLYPLSPQIPKLSDVLIWLSQIAEKSSSESPGHPIELFNIQYIMVRRPEKSKPKERYQVRVDVEFTAGNPTQARKFHEELLAQNPIVDPRQEVKWSLAGGKWRASFFLKDSTVYFP